MSPVDPREFETASAASPASEGGSCIRCGYDLSGLPDVTVCPECGASNAKPVRSERRESGVMRAPGRYVRALAWRLWLAAFSMLAMFLASVVAAFTPEAVGLGIELLIGLLWTGAVFLATSPKPDRFTPAQRDTFDDQRLRWLSVGSQALRPLEALLGMAALLPALAGVVAVEWARGAFMFLAALGYFPLCVQLASLAHWMGDEEAEGKCRAAAWCIAVGNGGRVLLPLLAAIVPFFGLLLVPLWIASVVGVVLLFVSLFALAKGASWAVQNAQHRSVVAGKRAQIERERADRRERERQERIDRAPVPDSTTPAAAPAKPPPGTPVPKTHSIDRGEDTDPYGFEES